MVVWTGVFGVDHSVTLLFLGKVPIPHPTTPARSLARPTFAFAGPPAGIPLQRAVPYYPCSHSRFAYSIGHFCLRFDAVSHYSFLTHFIRSPRSIKDAHCRHGSRGQVPSRRQDPPKMARSSKSKEAARAATNTTTARLISATTNAPSPPSQRSLLP